VIPLLLAPLLRDPLRRRFGTRDAAAIAAGILGAGGAAIRLALAGVDATLTHARDARARLTAPNNASPPPRLSRAQPAGVADLIYELLDAHGDTAQMAAALTCDPEWQGHLQYLQALQRKGRETLAQVSLEQAR